MQKNYLKGSYTVEASLIVTVTLFVLASLILCTFYIHDRAVLQGMVCEVASAGSNFATDKERKKAVQDISETVNANRLLGSRNLNGNGSTGSREVTALWNAEYPVPGFAAKYLSDSRLDIRKSWICKILNPANSIRKIKGAGELLTGGKH